MASPVFTTVAQHTGEEFERGELAPRNGEQPAGETDVNAAHDADAGAGTAAAAAVPSPSPRTGFFERRVAAAAAGDAADGALDAAEERTASAAKKAKPDDTEPYGVVMNFTAKFDVDEGTSDLSLELEDYSTSEGAEYESWALLAKVE